VVVVLKRCNGIESAHLALTPREKKINIVTDLKKSQRPIGHIQDMEIVACQFDLKYKSVGIENMTTW